MPRATPRAAKLPNRTSLKPAVPQSYNDSKTPATADDNLATPAVRALLDVWHHDLNIISGTLVLAFGKTGLSPGAGRAAVFQLRKVADDMERVLLGS